MGSVDTGETESTTELPTNLFATRMVSSIGDVVFLVGEAVATVATRLRVSSHHLITASSTFRAMLAGPFKEGLPQESLILKEIPLPKDDPEYMEMLMKIIHHQNKSVPTQLCPLAMLGLSKLAGKYDCAIALKFAASSWFYINDIDLINGNALMGDYISLVASAYLLRDPVAFRRYTRVLVMEYFWDTKDLLRQFDDQAIIGQTLFRLILALDHQRTEVFRNLETDVQALENQFPHRLQAPDVYTIFSNGTYGALFNFIRDKSSYKKQLFRGPGFMTIKQVIALIEDFDQYQAKDNYSGAMGASRDMRVITENAKRGARGLCLECLRGGEDFPEDCLEHMT